MPPTPVAKETCHVAACTPCLAAHDAIIRQLLQLKDSAQVRKTHFFAGRYENIYFEQDKLPELESILDFALSEASKLLACQSEELHLGFWFNLMQQGDVTLPHAHDDDDELLSATYYLQIPPESGKLLLKLPAGNRTIDPITGNFVFFHPAVEHEVTRHPHTTPRISLGINIGLKK